jgi:hypothetical protein
MVRKEPDIPVSVPTAATPVVVSDAPNSALTAATQVRKQPDVPISALTAALPAIPALPAVGEGHLLGVSQGSGVYWLLAKDGLAYPGLIDRSIQPPKFLVFPEVAGVAPHTLIQSKIMTSGTLSMVPNQSAELEQQWQPASYWYYHYCLHSMMMQQSQQSIYPAQMQHAQT